MRKIIVMLGLIVAIGAALCPAARADSWTISLLPGPDISGPAGSTIGWGFTVTNDSPDTLILYNVSADLFQDATPDAGIFPFPEVDPESSLTFDYIAGSQGLYELTWDAGAPIGFTNSGTFVVNALWCDDTGCTNAPDQSLDYSATVTGTSNVPEPATICLLGAGIALATWKRRSMVPTRFPQA